MLKLINQRLNHQDNNFLEIQKLIENKKEEANLKVSLQKIKIGLEKGYDKDTPLQHIRNNIMRNASQQIQFSQDKTYILKHKAFEVD